MSEFASAGLTAGQLNAIVKKLGGEDGARKFLRGEIVLAEPQCTWREQDGVIYFSVTSDGTTGEEWIRRLEEKGFRIKGSYVENIFRSPDFKPTSGVTTEVAILKGMIFENNDRVMNKIRDEANRRKFSEPNLELTCLIREKFTDKEIEAMGLTWIIVMHKPIRDPNGNSWLLDVDRNEGGRWLRGYIIGSFNTWSRDDGFAFVVSQVSSQS